MGDCGHQRGKMKSEEDWNAPNEGATNESEFTGIPSGKRDYLGEFLNKGNNSYYWIKNVNEPEESTTTTTVEPTTTTTTTE